MNSADKKRQKEMQNLQLELLRAKYDLFRKAKDANKYYEAQNLYDECQRIVDSESLRDEWSSLLLNLDYQWAKMRYSHSSLVDGEAVVRQIWVKACKKQGQQSELARDSLLLLGRILCEEKKFEDANEVLRPAYHVKYKDRWALAAGDLICEALAGNGRYQEAQMIQGYTAKAWLGKEGADGNNTIASGLLWVTYLERQLASIRKKPAAKDGEEDINYHWKRIVQITLQKVSKDVWRARNNEKDHTMLRVGQRLGEKHFRDKSYSAAESIFRHVWKARKRVLGEKDLDAFTSGHWLAVSLAAADRDTQTISKGADAHKRNITDKNKQAAAVCHELWDSQAQMSYKEKITLALGLVDADWKLGHYLQAQPVLVWLLDKPENQVDRKTHTNLERALKWLEREQRQGRHNKRK